MTSTFYDTQGNLFAIESTLDAERVGYASLFANAVSFRARHLKGSNTDGPTGAESSALSEAAAAPLAPPPSSQRQDKTVFPLNVKSNSLAETVLVTYIPLLSSLQGIGPSREAAALLVLQDHVRLRRQVEHPFLRSLFDVFYTQQVLCAPTLGAPVCTAVRRAVQVSSPSGSRAGRTIKSTSAGDTSTTDTSRTKSASAAQDGDVVSRDNAAACARSASVSASSDSSTSTSAGSTSVVVATTGSALVIIEEFIEGCTLADYADAVARRRLVPSSAKLQRDAAAIAYQLAQLLHYLHSTAHVLCRELPSVNITLDQNKGFISVRLPLSAVRLLQESGERYLPHAVAALVSETSQQNRETESCWTDEARPLRAPELRHLAYWESTWNPILTGNPITTPHGGTGSTDGNEPGPFGAADVWTLGLITTLLCTLNHKQFAQTTRAERVNLVHAQVNRLTELLPTDTPDGMLHLIRSCLEPAPTKRPTAAGVLRSTAFVTHRSHTELEQHRAVISIAEAVANANKRKMPPAALQLAETAAASRNNSSGTATAAAAAATPPSATYTSGGIPVDTALTLLSLQDTEWDVPPRFRDVFMPLGTGTPLVQEPTTPHSAQVLRRATPSLSQATQDAFQDLERLCAQHARLYPTDPQAGAAVNTSAVSGAGSSNGGKAGDTLRERLRRSHQMPRDLSATTRVFEELTERFAQLQSTNPDASFRFIELLLEGFSSCPQDVAVVRDSVTMADALLHATWTPPAAEEEVAEHLNAFEESMLSSATETDPRDFQVADVLRSMPTMPERMLASDRAANTSAVLYNQWLKKEKKKFVKFDGY